MPEMPTRLTPPRHRLDDVRALRLFIGQRQKNWHHVRRDFDILRQQYLAYENNFEQCQPYDLLRPRSARARHLNGLYDQSPKCLAYIVDLRKRANKHLAVCPYCGIPGRLTLDHYLPRATNAFPQFSVFSLNLVPACDACQSKKGAFYPIEVRLQSRKSGAAKLTRRRRMSLLLEKSALIAKHSLRAPKRPRSATLRVLHPYFDAFLSDVVWRLDIGDQHAPLDTLTLVPAVSNPGRAAQVQFHVDKLGVRQRSDKEVAYWVGRLVLSLREEGIQTVADARDLVRRELSIQETSDGTRNSIACVALRAVNSNAAVLMAIVAKAAMPPPTRIMRSQGIRF